MLLIALALAAAPLLPDTASAPPAPAEPGAFIVHEEPTLPLLSLRLSLLVDDPPGYAGAGHLQQHLIYPELRQAVERVGGRAEIARTPDALVYSVTGPAAELTYLARVLRSALAVPPVSPAVFLAAVNEIREERTAEWETPADHVRARLRLALFPDQLSAAGTAAAADRLDAEGLRASWALMYRPERAVVVAAGGVRREQVEAVFATLPTANSGSAPSEALRDSVPAAPPQPAEATREWAGAAYRVDDADPATLSVATHLLEEDLRRRLPPAAIATAEHWWTHLGQALVLMEAVPANNAAGAAPLGSAAAELRDRLGDEQVRRAGAALRHELLLAARSPERMASLLGAFADRTGAPDAAQRFYAALARVEPQGVRELLDRLASVAPVVVRIPGQKVTAR